MSFLSDFLLLSIARQACGGPRRERNREEGEEDDDEDAGLGARKRELREAAKKLLIRRESFDKLERSARRARGRSHL